MLTFKRQRPCPPSCPTTQKRWCVSFFFGRKAMASLRSSCSGRIYHSNDSSPLPKRTLCPCGFPILGLGQRLNNQKLTNNQKHNVNPWQRLADYGSLATTIVLLCCVTCGVRQRPVFNAPPFSRKFTYYSYAKRIFFCS